MEAAGRRDVFGRHPSAGVLERHALYARDGRGRRVEPPTRLRRGNDAAASSRLTLFRHRDNADRLIAGGVLGVAELPDGKPRRVGNRVPNYAWGADGRYLAFASYEPLVPDDVNATPDVYLYNLASGTNQVVSLRPDGTWTVGGTFVV